jgi:hypothetical protein
MLAFPTRARLRPLADEPLPEPEREPLLPDAARPVQEQRPRQRVATNGVVEASAEGGVAVEGEEGHDPR